MTRVVPLPTPAPIPYDPPPTVPAEVVACVFVAGFMLLILAAMRCGRFSLAGYVGFLTAAAMILAAALAAIRALGIAYPGAIAC